MGTIKPWLAAALLGTAVAFGPAAAFAAKDTFSIGAVLEPPHLDPTAGAAAAIDEVVFINVFEGLVRLDERLVADQDELRVSGSINLPGTSRVKYRAISTS